MNYRPLGKTGLNVSDVGMGTWQLAGNPWGWDAPDEKESMSGSEIFTLTLTPPLKKMDISRYENLRAMQNTV